MNTASKIHTLNSLQAAITRWRLKSDVIVFTNGCFDILHYGHVEYLESAKSLGDRLIVGLNSDASVRRIKGKHRPIQDEQSRSRVLCALQCVDAVVIFDEDTPIELIKQIQPDILVKGGDYTVDQVVGKEWAKRVEIIPFVQGYSTTLIEQKIRQNS
ncbi:MAG: D-glycero-beta-D-manno-heptose 1-phosphate adenylyltransferase [Bacteroidia bacterium]|nr:D-glycero-beta-D-manno-heptose 1-phosphate adenylyltransferase [Bacteroidia bacterium]MDW8300951.1 D-glycero-beta-D-manno-heptose 1-phosphate adenylyltransferase [Bacteroidia bacterium]